MPTMMRDLFGKDVPMPTHSDPAMTPKERNRLYRKAASLPRGYAMPPGTGPDGETCGSCRHKAYNQPGAGRFIKCGLMRAVWTHGPKTDIRAKAPACKLWAARPS